MTSQSLSRNLAWALLAFILFVTVCPIEFRPKTETTVDLDRALAFAVTGFVFVMAYPQRWKELLVLLPVAAFGLELLQYLSASRHPHLSDAAFKALGAYGGIACGRLAGLLLDMRKRRIDASASLGAGGAERRISSVSEGRASRSRF